MARWCWCRPNRAPISWHGDVYDFHQDSSWNAKSAFAAPKPDNSRDQFGATAGFPIRSERLFALRQRRPQAVRRLSDLYARSVPGQRAGAPRLTRGNDTPANRAFIEACWRGFPTSRRTTRAARAPIRPRSRSTSRPTIIRCGSTGAPNAAHTLTGRYQWTRQIFESDDVIRGEQARQNNRQGNIGITWTHVLDRHRRRIALRPGPARTRVDIAAGNDTPIVRFAASPVSGSIIGNAGNFPINRDQTDHQFVYNLSRLFGSDTRSRRASICASSSSTISPTILAAGSGLSPRAAAARCIHRPTRRCSTAASPASRRVGTVLPREPHQRIQPLCRRQLAGRLEPDAEPGPALRIRRCAGEKRRPARLRVRRRHRQHRAAFRVRLYAVVDEWPARTPGGRPPGTFSIRGGFGLYDGRLFQSVFSQTGASLRTNPPNALVAHLHDAPSILNLADPTRLRVHARPADGATHADHRGSRRSRCHGPSSGISRWNARCRSIRRCGSRTRARKGNGLLRYALDNLPVSPLVGPVLVVDHPNNAPAAGFPDLRGKTIDRDCGRRALRRHRAARYHRQRPVPGRCADRRQRDQLPLAADQRAAARSALHDQPAGEQRCRELVPRAAGRMDAALRQRVVVPDQLHVEQERGHDVGGDVRRCGRQQPAWTRRAVPARPLSLPHPAPLHVQWQLPAAVPDRSAGCARHDRRRLDALGDRAVRARHAVHRHRYWRTRSQLRRLHREPADPARRIAARHRRLRTPTRRARSCRATSSAPRSSARRT